jgi:hypothetical protein
VRDALVVLFWLWVLVALGVYAYRIWRRISKGPKAEREAGAAAGRGPLAGPAPPPLPDGPVEARLPRSLRDAPPAEAPGRVDGGAPGAAGAAAPTAEASPSAPTPPTDAATTVADAVQGIELPEGLLPVVEMGDQAMLEGRRARFSATATTVESVAAALAAELDRLGYAVDGLDTVRPDRAGLSAVRGTTAVTTKVHLDDDTGAVLVELSL